MILNIIVLLLSLVIAAAIAYLIYREIIDTKKLKESILAESKNKNKKVTAMGKTNQFDKFINNDMSFDEIRNHALEIERVKKALMGGTKEIIEVDYVTASQILKNWDKKVLISEDGKIVLTSSEKEKNLNHKVPSPVANKPIKKPVEIEKEETDLTIDLDVEKIEIKKEEEIEEKKEEVELKIINEKKENIEEAFEKIIKRDKIRVEDDFFDYIFENNFSTSEKIKNSLENILNKNLHDVVKFQEKIYVKSEMFFKSLLELDNDINLDEIFAEEYFNIYISRPNDRVKSNFIKNINNIVENIFLINEKGRVARSLFFVLNKSKENEREAEGMFLIINNCEFIKSSPIKETDFAILSHDEIVKYKNKKIK